MKSGSTKKVLSKLASNNPELEAEVLNPIEKPRSSAQEPTEDLWEVLEKQILPTKIAQYTKVAKKTGGQTQAGVVGGIYEYEDRNEYGELLHKNNILFKQDAEKGGLIFHHKNIAEVVTGNIMHKLIGGSVAPVFFATSPEYQDKPSDKNDAHVYVGSIFYSQYQNLYEDIYQSQGLPIPKDRPRRAGTSSQALIMPGWNEIFRKGLLNFENGRPKYIKSGIPDCKYDDFEKVTVACLLTGDFDNHSANVGVVGGGKKKKIVKIDHAWGLHDLEDDVHMHSHSRHIFPGEPTNHIREYPRELKISKPFAEQLEKQALIDVSSEIDNAIEDAAKYYSITSLKMFGKHIGMKKKDVKLSLSVKENIKEYLKNKMKARAKSLKDLALEIKLSLSIKKENGSYVFDDSVYKIEDLIQDNPIYFFEAKYHFRQANQSGKLEELGVRIKEPYHTLLTKLVQKKTMEVLQQPATVEIIKSISADAAAESKDNSLSAPLANPGLSRLQPNRGETHHVQEREVVAQKQLVLNKYEFTIKRDDKNTLTSELRNLPREALQPYQFEGYQFPNKLLIKAAIRQVEALKKHQAPPFNLKSVRNKSLAEAILLYTKSQNYQCSNNTGYEITIHDNLGAVNAFKKLLIAEKEKDLSALYTEIKDLKPAIEKQSSSDKVVAPEKMVRLSAEHLHHRIPGLVGEKEKREFLGMKKNRGIAKLIAYENITESTSLFGKKVKSGDYLNNYTRSMFNKAGHSPLAAIYETMPGFRGWADVLAIPNMIFSRVAVTLEYGLKSAAFWLAKPIQNPGILPKIYGLIPWVIGQGLNLVGNAISWARKMVDGITNLIVKSVAVIGSVITAGLATLTGKTPHLASTNYPPFGATLRAMGRAQAHFPIIGPAIVAGTTKGREIRQEKKQVKAEESRRKSLMLPVSSLPKNVSKGDNFSPLFPKIKEDKRTGQEQPSTNIDSPKNKKYFS